LYRARADLKHGEVRVGRFWRGAQTQTNIRCKKKFDQKSQSRIEVKYWFDFVVLFFEVSGLFLGRKLYWVCFFLQRL
jgi:hypothetical protein